MGKAHTKGNNLVQDNTAESQIEVKRLITTDGVIIKYMADNNFIIYYPDGSLTYSDKRKATWYTVNPKGVKRVRKITDGIVKDEVTRLKIQTKIDPETNASLKIREDGVLTINYVDKTEYIIMPDNTSILKKVVDGTTTTFITKEGYVPVR